MFNFFDACYQQAQIIMIWKLKKNVYYSYAKINA